MEYCLLHGLGQSPADWAAVEAGLPGQKILCPDLAAWWADRPVTYESLLEGLEAQCAGREEAMVLCGCSLGAILALDYAWRHPRQVSALVLIAPRVRMPRGLLRLQNGVFRLLPARAFAGQGMGKDQVLSLTRSMLALDLTPAHTLCLPSDGMFIDHGIQFRNHCHDLLCLLDNIVYFFLFRIRQIFNIKRFLLFHLFFRKKIPSK